MDEIEIVSESLKYTDLRNMERLGQVKIKGKAKPVKIGFKRTKLIFDSK